MPALFNEGVALASNLEVVCSILLAEALGLVGGLLQFLLGNGARLG